MSSRNHEPLAVELADVIPQLALKDGTTLMLAGLGSESMRPTRIQYAEALIGWLRDNGHMPKPKAAKPAKKQPPARKRPAGGSGEANAR